tara:strand:+ start:153 stop:449 length:297 start_codon:yes stop_codon:yes gene_type:complete
MVPKTQGLSAQRSNNYLKTNEINYQNEVLGTMADDKQVKKGILGKVAKSASKKVSVAAKTAKTQATAKATEFVVKQAKKNAEKKMDNMKNKFLGKKKK